MMLLVMTVLLLAGAPAMNPRAWVNADGVTVHAGASQYTRVLRTAAKGEALTIAYSVTIDHMDWCALGGAQRGYIDCKYLIREREPESPGPDAPLPPVLVPHGRGNHAVHPPEPVMHTPAQSALINAAKLGEIAAIDSAIEQGALAAGRDPEGRTALLWATSMGHIDAAKELLRAGSDVNAADNAGWTPLAAAVRARHREMVELLLDAGAEVNPQDIEGRTPLMYAAEHDDLRVIRDLLAKGGDPNANDGLGRTPLMSAAALNETAPAEALIAAGADVSAWDSGGRSVLINTVLSDTERTAMIRLLIRHGANVHARDNQGRTALSLALKNGYISTAQLLKTAGATGW